MGNMCSACFSSASEQDDDYERQAGTPSRRRSYSNTASNNHNHGNRSNGTHNDTAQKTLQLEEERAKRTAAIEARLREAETRGLQNGGGKLSQQLRKQSSAALPPNQHGGTAMQWRAGP